MPPSASVIFNKIELADISLDSLLETIREKKLTDLAYIVTPNADHFCRLANANNRDFIEAYQNANLRICDSRIIQKLSFLEKRKIQHVIPGSDLTRCIIEAKWAKDIQMLVIGPHQCEVENIIKKFKTPNLKHYTPPMGFIKQESEVNKCIDVIANSQADIIFLAIGSPQQEILANLVKKRLAPRDKKTILLCIGASFDFLSGKTSRAPKLVQKMHLEWLHRSFSDPKRLFPRYQSNFLWIASYLIRKISRQ
jgi:exopolysaccharide biosynthesis WecB/TagA/CpsF family protein